MRDTETVSARVFPISVSRSLDDSNSETRCAAAVATASDDVSPAAPYLFNYAMRLSRSDALFLSVRRT